MSMQFSPVPGSRDRYDKTSSVPTYRALQPQLLLELRRARRYEHPLSVVMLSTQANGGARYQNGNGSIARTSIDSAPALYALLGGYLRNTLRETDILAGLPESLAYAMFLPGVGRQGAELALARCREGFLQCAGVDLRGGAAAFPDNGLTIEDVLAEACAAWGNAGKADVSGSHVLRISHG